MHEHFDGQVAFEHIEELSELRRLPGSPGEAQARRYVLDAGREAGMDMSSEEFSYSSAPLKVVLPMLCLMLGAVSLTGSLTYLWGTPLTAVPGAVLLVLIYMGFKWSSGFERFAERGGDDVSANVIGEIKAADPRGVILLSAHYDSKSQLMPVVMRAAFFILGFMSAVFLGLALVVLGIVAAAGPDVLGSPEVFYVSLVPAFFLLALVFNFTGNRSPGALDNAAGEAVILEMGRVLASQPLEHFDVRVLSFGCEEVGLCGSIVYMLGHEDELRSGPCYMLNFDMPFSPAGTVALNTGFEVPPRYTSEKLNELARTAAAEMGFELKGIFLPVGAAADHMPWCKHGFEVAGFVSATTYVHRASDSVDRINREGLRRTGEVALSVVRALDQELSENCS
jgi:Peptidase family M28